MKFSQLKYRIYRYIGEDEEPRTFTQEDVNKIMADNKRNMQEQLETLKGDFETIQSQNQTLQETAKLSDEQLAQFQTEQETMRQRGLSEAQQWAEQKAKYENSLKETQRSRDEAEQVWKGKYHTTLIDNALTAACTPCDDHNGAMNPEQITALLRGRTYVDEENNIFVRDFEVKDADGKSEKRDVSPNEAVTVYSQLESHSNLFNSKGKVGTGDNSSPGSGGNKSDPTNGPSDPTSLKDMETWMHNNM